MSKKKSVAAVPAKKRGTSSPKTVVKTVKSQHEKNVCAGKLAELSKTAIELLDVFKGESLGLFSDEEYTDHMIYWLEDLHATMAVYRDMNSKSYRARERRLEIRIRRGF